MLDEIRKRCETVEECYEFMLAYAAQGLPSEHGSQTGAQIREFLERAGQALSGLAETCTAAVHELGLDPAGNIWRSLPCLTATLAILSRPSNWFWPNPPSVPH